MKTVAELKTLLSGVHFEASYNAVEGSMPFRGASGEDREQIRTFLIEQLPTLRGRIYDEVLFIIAESFLESNLFEPIQELYLNHSGKSRAAVLNALWEKSSCGPQIVVLALGSVSDVSPEVRSEGCIVVRNQAENGVDVSACIPYLRKLLADRNATVRMLAECAVGTLAKKKYKLESLLPGLLRNIKDDDISVQHYSAWALWHLSRSKHDIGVAVPDLAWLFAESIKISSCRESAGGALLHYGKQSPERGRYVKDALLAVGGFNNTQHYPKLVAKLSQLGETEVQQTDPSKR